MEEDLLSVLDGCVNYINSVMLERDRVDVAEATEKLVDTMGEEDQATRVSTGHQLPTVHGEWGNLDWEGAEDKVTVGTLDSGQDEEKIEEEEEEEEEEEDEDEDEGAAARRHDQAHREQRRWLVPMGSSGSDLVGVLDPPQEISRQSEVVHQEQKAIHEAYQSMFRHRTQSVGLRPSRSWGGSQFEHMQDLVAVAEAEEGEEKREDEGSASSQQQPLSIPLSAQEVQGQTGMSPPPYLPPSLSMDFAVTFRRRNRNRKGRKASERHHRVQQTGSGG